MFVSHGIERRDSRPSSRSPTFSLRTIRDSGGTAAAVPDQAMARWVETVGADTGLFTSPEGDATLAAVEELRESGFLGLSDEVVVFATASGLKYVGWQPRRTVGDSPFLVALR